MTEQLEKPRRLYPTAKDGQPLLTNWTQNRSLFEWTEPKHGGN